MRGRGGPGTQWCTQGVLLPPPLIIAVGSNFPPQVGTFLCVQDGIGWGHDPPTIIPVPVPLQSAFLQSVVARMVLKN